MTEEQKQTYAKYLESVRKLTWGAAFGKDTLAALEACWADRERAVEAMRQVSMNDVDGVAGPVEDALRAMGEKTPWD